MKPFVPEALELFKKFAAKCNLDFNHIEKSFPYAHFEKSSQARTAIEEKDVKEYFFLRHNEILFERLKLGNVPPDKALWCMTEVKMVDGKLFCVHRGDIICEITREEADSIEETAGAIKKFLSRES